MQGFPAWIAMPSWEMPTVHGASSRDGDLLADETADGLVAIAHELGAVGRSTGIPRFFAEVGFAEISELVRGEPLEAAVVEFFRPHAGYKVAQIFDELAVLHRVDRAGTEKVSRDFQGRLARVDLVDLQVVEPGGAGALAKADIKDNDARQSPRRRLEREIHLRPLGVATVIGPAGDDLPASRSLDLKRAEDRRSRGSRPRVRTQPVSR